MTDPTLSIVVAAQTGSSDLSRWLEAIRRQVASVNEDVEIIVVTTGSEQAMNSNDGFSAVEIVTSESSSFPKMLGLGARIARARHIALTESCFAPDEAWIDGILRAIAEHPTAIIGGAVDPGGGLSWMNRSMYLCDYAGFASSALSRGQVDEVPGCNVVFPATVLPNHELLETDGLWKSFLCADLVASGTSLVAEPSIRVCCERRMGAWAWWTRRLAHGRCFGGMRARRISPALRILHVVLVPATTLLVTWRVTRRIARTPLPLGSLMLHLPGVIAGMISWMIGECIGNLFGSGQACHHL